MKKNFFLEIFEKVQRKVSKLNWKKKGIIPPLVYCKVTKKLKKKKKGKKKTDLKTNKTVTLT